MKKERKKLLSLILVLSLVVGLLMPFNAGYAAETAEQTGLEETNVPENSEQTEPEELDVPEDTEQTYPEEPDVPEDTEEGNGEGENADGLPEIEEGFDVNELSETELSPAADSSTPSLVIEQFTSGSGETIQAEKLSETVYLIDYADVISDVIFNTVNDVFIYLYWSITGTLSAERTIQKVYFNGIGASKDDFSLEKSEDGSFTFQASEAFDVDDGYRYANNYGAMKGAGCFYLQLDNGEIYTIIFITNYNDGYADWMDGLGGAFSKEEFPSYIGFYNDTKGESMDADWQVIGDSLDSGRATRVIERTLTSATADAYRVQVFNNEDYGCYIDGTTAVVNYNRFNWTDMMTNYVLVNGEPLPAFFSGDNDASRNVRSAAFYLKPGMNVVEICPGMVGASANRSDTPWYHSAKPIYANVIYLINYEGPEAPAGAASANTDTSLAYLRATIQSRPDLIETVVTWNEAAQRYDLVVPEILRTDLETDGFRSYYRSVLLSIKPEEAGSTITILQTDGNENLVEGDPVGCVWALKIPELNNEQKQFVIRVTAEDGTTYQDYPVQVIFASSDTSMDGMSLDGAEFSSPFDPETLDYYVDFPSAQSTATLTVTPAEGTTVSVNGAPYTAPVTLSAAQDLTVVSVVAADGYTSTKYYLVTRLPDGQVPYFTISEETRQRAETLLEPYYNTRNNAKEFGNYWTIFMAKAVDKPGEEPFSFDGLNVYDVRKHTMKQTTDWAACIMEIVMLGGNPYDFPRYVDGELVEHFDYVQGMIDGGGGPFACNVWYTWAASATGSEQRFVNSGKSAGLSWTCDLDTRAWWIAALASVLEPLEMARYVDSLHDSQVLTEGKKADIGLFCNNIYPLGDNNLYTNGCVLSAIASASVDIDKQFAVGDKKPIELLGNLSDFSMVKDMVVGLGDTINGSNVLSRYALTEERYNALIAKAEENGISTDGMPEYGGIDYGKKYFELYSQVGAALAEQGDYSMTPRVTYGLSYQIFEDDVNALPAAEAITEADLDNVKKVIDEYEALTDSFKGYVSTAAMEKYYTVVSAALTVQDETGATADIYNRILALPDPLVIGNSEKDEVEAIRAAYDALSDEQKALIDWSGASTLSKLEACEEPFKPTPVEPVNPSNPSGPSTPTRRMTITFELLGAPNDGENGTVNTLKAGNLETWYTTTQTFNASSISAEQAFRLIMDKAGIEWRGNSNNEFGSIYITGIQSPKTGEWMEEMTTTNNSGWMYTINGKHPNVGMTNSTLYDGDAFIVHYTDDYTQEQDASEWAPSTGTNTGTSGSNSTANNSVINVEATANSKGEAAVQVTEAALKDAITAVKNSSVNTITVRSEVTGNTAAVSVAFPKAAAAEVVRQTSAELCIETPVGQINIPNDTLSALLDAAKSTDLTLTITAQTASQAQELLDRMAETVTPDQIAGSIIAEVTLTSGETPITAWGGKALTLHIPVNDTHFEVGKSYTVYQFSQDGTSEELTGTCLELGNQLFVQITVTHLSTFVVLPEAVNETDQPIVLPFTDVQEDDWFYDTVMYAYTNDLFKGTSETTFEPNGTMTRGMFITVIYRIEGEPDVAGTNPFTDVPNDDWYTNAVIWANANGIVNGVTETSCAPNDSITREQAAAMLMRYANYKDYDTTATADLDRYADQEQISDWAYRAMQWANGQGLIIGRTETSLDPLGTATRAEVAAILMRFLESGEE